MATPVVEWHWPNDGTTHLPGGSRIESAIRLFHHRWSVPTTWVLYDSGPKTFTGLLRQLNTSRDTLSDTLRSLVSNGLVLRPVRPRGNYTLSPAGEIVGEACGPVVAAVQKAGVLQVALKKWPMIVLTSAGRGNGRYFELKASLPGITPRALSHALRDLEEIGLLEHVPIGGAPPAYVYRLTPAAVEMFPALDALVQACERAIMALPTSGADLD